MVTTDSFAIILKNKDLELKVKGMLLHKYDINVAIAVILLYRTSLHDLPRRTYEIVKDNVSAVQMGMATAKSAHFVKVYPTFFNQRIQKTSQTFSTCMAVPQIRQIQDLSAGSRQILRINWLN